MKSYLIVIAGLPGTGKTTAGRKLRDSLDNYFLVDQNELRREAGMKRMPENQDRILRGIDKLVGNYLGQGNGVIVESGHRHQFRRQQLYGIASSHDTNVVIIECVCSEALSKYRMGNRNKSDRLISDPRNPEVYNRIKSLWEDIDNDFRYLGVDYFVSYMTFDSKKQIVNKNRISKGMKAFIKKVEGILK